MKYLKTLALALGVFAMASCSDNDKREMNTASDVTVTMTNQEMSFRENKGIVNVPITVTGESNGYIEVTVQVEEYQNPGIPMGEVAMEDAHFFVTTKAIAIEPGATSAYVEFALVDDKVINEPRSFKVTLETAEGATIGAQNATIVNINDNDSEPYDRLGGEWFVLLDGKPSGTALFDSFDPDEEGYNDFYKVTGLCGNAEIEAKFKYNSGTKDVTITIEYGQKMIISVNGTEYMGELCYINDAGYITSEGTVTYTLNLDESPDEMTFVSGPQGDYADFYLVYKDGGGYGLYAQALNVTGFKKP